MQTLASLRFRLLLDIAKHVIFAVDDALARFARHPDPAPSATGHAVRIPSADRTLAGWVVEPEAAPIASVLIFHGIGDRLRYWRAAQQHLAARGVSSLVFHYSGYPASGGATTPENLACDAHAAYAFLRAHTAAPAYLLGFSLGSGLAAEVASTLVPPPTGVILAQAFTSLRHAARRMVRPAGFLALLLPDLWKTHENIARLKMPLLILHTTGDALFPVAMAETNFAAAQTADPSPQLTILNGHRHNAIFATIPEEYWAAILNFIARTSKLECSNGTRRDQ